MNNEIKNKSIASDEEHVFELEKEASKLSARLLPLVGMERMEQFIAEQTNDTMLEGTKIDSSGALDFSEPEERFSKLPPLWLKLAEKFLEQFIAGLERMLLDEPEGKSGIAAPVIAVTSETKEMMARLGLGDLIAKGLIENIETDFETKDGKIKPVNITASALRDKSGNIHGMVITAKDLSEVQKLQKEKLEITEKSKEEAEKMVKQRTMQLKQKIFELERFNKLAVGRELKMIELKKEIERLEGKKHKETETQKTK